MFAMFLRPFQLALLLLTLIILPGAVAAQPPQPSLEEMKAQRWASDLLPDALPLASAPGSEQVAEAPASPGGTSIVEEWWRMAFQSYRDGNWEIYVALGDGSDPIRRTMHGASDVRPRLTRGGAQVAFSSNRDGNYEIYVMNADGSGQTRLTNNSASDTSPAWSPDGRRIVFQSYRDGNWEIYAMNADGSGQTRLTNNAAPDATPAWSPDGTRIAWVRVSGNDGILWVMNADGSNPHALTGPLRFLQNPIWSPDGAHLAFDYDADGDVWAEVATMRADGSGLQPMYDAGQNLVDLWMGAWSPDGAWLLFSRVEYVIYNNELYLLHTYVQRAALTGGPFQPITTSGYDLLPDWQGMDN